jgi:hypothetical protein
MQYGSKLGHYNYCHVSGVPWLIIAGYGLDDWIYWHFYYNYTYLQSIITAHNRWLPKTRSIPYWTTSVFSPTVTDLVLIYQSATSSASVVRRLTLHRWTLSWMNHDDFSFTNELADNSSTNELIKVRVRVTLRLEVYRQSVRLGDKPLETHDQKFYLPLKHLRL